MQFEYAIALTGSIATGKSSVATMLAGFGLHIIDADGIAHQILDEQSSQIASIFGREYISDGAVNRSALGKLVFGDEMKRRELEALLHPLIRAEIETQSKEQEKKERAYIIDIPLFFESSNYDIESVIVVYAPREIQLERLMRRDSYSKDEALARIESQIDIEQKRDRATYLIDNSGDLDQLYTQCRRVYLEITERDRA